MPWVICTLVGMAVGAALTFFVLYPWSQTAKQRWTDAQATLEKTRVREAELRSHKEQFEQQRRTSEAEYAAHRQQLVDDTKAAEAKVRAWAQSLSDQWHSKQSELNAQEQTFKARVISYEETVAENKLLKRDLQNLDVTLHKAMLDHDATSQRQIQLDGRANDLAKRYLKDTIKWVFTTLNVNNFATVKARLVDAYQRCRDIGFAIPVDQEKESLGELQAEYERIVRAAVEREEQARIKAQIREEARLQREVDEELAKAARERALIERALADALAKSRDEHSAEVEALRTQLADAEAKSQRAISMAQQTKAGNVYVISNIGAFGEGVFKVGMTRRLEPKDRIKELGDASVPFPFDVHMMISCDDAPALENALHRELHRTRLNRVNPRKEFFRTDVGTIANVVKEHRGEVQYVVHPEALEYHQSLSMSDEDAAFIEQAYEQAEAETGISVGEE